MRLKKKIFRMSGFLSAIRATSSIISQFPNIRASIWVSSSPSSHINELKIVESEFWRIWDNWIVLFLTPKRRSGLAIFYLNFDRLSKSGWEQKLDELGLNIPKEVLTISFSLRLGGLEQVQRTNTNVVYHPTINKA